MPRFPDPEVQPAYALLSRWVDVALRRDGSLLTPDRQIWSAANAEDLYRRFVLKPDESDRDFMVKFRDQLQGAPAATIQLAAELLLVHLVVVYGMKGKSKRELVKTVLSWSSQQPNLPAELDAALEPGFIRDVGYLLRRPFMLQHFIEFLRRWKALSVEDRTLDLSDPWRFKEFAKGVPDNGADGQREVLLFYVFPEQFEAISSPSHKRKIVTAYASRIKQPSGDVDKDLLQVRQSMEAEHGPGFHFYDEQVRPQWDPKAGVSQSLNPWDSLVHWAKRFYELPSFEEAERQYKLDISQTIAEARRALIGGDGEWLKSLKKAFGPPNNLTAWQLHDKFLNWSAENPVPARTALETLWGDGDVLDRVRRFASLMGPAKIGGGGSQANLAGFLLLGESPERNIPFRYKVVRGAMKLVGEKLPPAATEAEQLYGAALQFVDKFLAEAAARGLTMRDRLDAQGVVWSMIRYKDRPSTWSEEDWKAFKAYRGAQVATDNDDIEELEVHPDPTGLAQLADELLLDEPYLRRVEDLLRQRGQIIMYGPPGTGKTYVAQRLARHLAGEGFVRTVQFHPSYSYEDFVEGFRPAQVNGAPGFRLASGPLLRAAEQARANPSQPVVLIIDEINRGNLAKVLGELYFLLEYRDQELSLQYSEKPFSLPHNLWVIGTMNTADRSIALLDAALRRRFYFVPFFPDEPPVSGLLHRWLSRHAPGLSWVAGVVDSANEVLGDRNLSVGPSYFMRPGLTVDQVEIIWDHAVRPYLEEQLFGDKEKLSKLTLENLRAKSTRTVTIAVGEPALEGA